MQITLPNLTKLQAPCDHCDMNIKELPKRSFTGEGKTKRRAMSDVASRVCLYLEEHGLLGPIPEKFASVQSQSSGGSKRPRSTDGSHDASPIASSPQVKRQRCECNNEESVVGQPTQHDLDQAYLNGLSLVPRFDDDDEGNVQALVIRCVFLFVVVVVVCGLWFSPSFVVFFGWRY